jgi:hypothetical protein
MDSDLVVKSIAVIVGLALVATSIVGQFRRSRVSTPGVVMLVIGAVLIVFPALSSFTLKGSSFEFSAITKPPIGEGEQGHAGQVSAAAARAPSVRIYYTDSQKALALKIADYLQYHGYPSNAVHTDFSEIDMKEAPGTVRFAFTKYSQDLAKKLESSLQPLLPTNTPIVDQYREVLGSGDVQIQLF